MNLLLFPSTLTYGNAGDLAMLLVAIKRIEALLPRCALHVVTEDPETASSISPLVIPLTANPNELPFQANRWLRATKRALGPLERRAPRAMHGVTQAASRFRPDYSATERVQHALRECDGVVFSGGGFLTEAFRGSCEAAITVMERAVSLEKPVFLMGQGIGPIKTSSLRERLSAVLKGVVQAYLREPLESPLIFQEGIGDYSESIVTGDDAIEIVRAHCDEIPVREAVGINLRLAGYAGMGIKAARRLAHVLGRVGEQLGLRFRPIPIVLGGPHDDYGLVERIAGHSGASSRPNMVFEMISDWRGKPRRCLLCRFDEIIRSSSFFSQESSRSKDEPLGREARGQEHSTCCSRSSRGWLRGPLAHLDLAIEAAGGCRVVVAGSYHAAVFALSQGVPVVAAYASDYYQSKFAGLAAMFPGGVSLLDLRLRDVEGSLRPLLERAWHVQPSLARRLKKRADRQVVSSWQAYRFVAEYLEGGKAAFITHSGSKGMKSPPG